MKYFKCIEHPLDLTKYTICVTDDLCATFAPLKGTYGIVPARVLGLSMSNTFVICFSIIEIKLVLVVILARLCLCAKRTLKTLQVSWTPECIS